MRLSVCIPTHDGRRDELVEALEAIVAQLGPEHAGRVEVCIADNASSDGTAAAVEALAREHPVVYERHDRDIGPGANVLAAVALATGDWLWLHSSDDVLVPGAIDAVLRRLEDASGLAGLSLGRARMDRELRHEVPPEPAAALPGDPDRPHVYADPREALAQTGIMQSYLTSTIVRRAAWEAVVARDPGAVPRATPYFPHTYIIARALLDGAGAWAWEPRKLVLTRTGNELFDALGGDPVAASVFMPVQLTRMWRTLLAPRDPALRALRARMQALWAAPEWIGHVKRGPLAGTRADVRLLGLVRPLWRLPRFWAQSAPRLAVPHRLARGAGSARLRVLRMGRLPGTLGVARVTAELPPRAEAGASIRLRCTVAAFGTRALRTALPHPVYLAVDWDGPEQGRPASQRLALPATARRGRPVVVEVGTSAPWTPGEHRLAVGLWQDGVGRLDAADPASSATRTVRVVAPPGDDGDGDADADAGPAAGRAALRAAVGRIPLWWHSIDLGGVVTPGVKTPAILAAELAGLRLPDLRGRTVLDVGAWDGYYSFAAERAGAARVVALDHLVWAAEMSRFTRLWSAVLEELPAGRVPPDAVDVLRASELWDPAGLPGRAGFDLAHRALGSEVESVVGDIARDDLAGLGRFDVVLFLGVLYHLRDPLGALRWLHALCDDLAIIETEAIAIGGHPDAAAAQFMGTRKRRDDPTNWWAPTAAGLERWCLEAGFSRVERVSGRLPEPRAGTTTPCRVTVHAWR